PEGTVLTDTCGQVSGERGEVASSLFVNSPMAVTKTHWKRTTATTPPKRKRRRITRNEDKRWSSSARVWGSKAKESAKSTAQASSSCATVLFPASVSSVASLAAKAATPRFH
ncbi:unnamed protein product, partial [Brassica oleracea]